MKYPICLFLCLCVSLGFSLQTHAQTKPLSISAAGAVVLDMATGAVLFEKNADTPMPMASTTKIMTTLLLLEQGNLQEPFTVTKEMVQVEGTSMGLLAGDTVTPLALCYGMMLSSGNDAANAAAIRHSGSVAAFANAMNQKAEALGMKNTLFVTPSGLDEGGHHSTAYDMALLTAHALENPTFREIVQSQSHRLAYGNPPYPRTLTNHNRLLKEVEGCIGVKTGFTKKAGRCLVSAATRQGATVICVTLKAPNDWSDHKQLLDYGFSQLQEVSQPKTTFSLPTVGGVAQRVSLTHEQLTCHLPRAIVGEVEFTVAVPGFLYAPVLANHPVGELQLRFKDRILASTPILTCQEVAAQPYQPGFFARFFQNLRRFLA